MKKHEALMREAEISKARSSAFKLGILVGMLLGAGLALIPFWLVPL